MKKLLTVGFLISCVTIVLLLILYALFKAYPAENANWANLISRGGWFLSVALSGLIATGSLLLLGYMKGKKTIVLLCTAIVFVIGSNFYLSRSSEGNHIVEPPSGKFDFTADWTSQNIKDWEQILAPLKDRPDIKALEVGSYEGRSAVWFLQNILTGANSSITCIDIFDQPAIEARYDKNMSATGNSAKVIKIKDRSDRALTRLKPASYDLIYIDGSHYSKDVLVDAVFGWELLKPNGIMIFDDYDWHNTWAGALLSRHKTPQMALDGFLTIYGPYIDVIKKDYQLTVRKRADIEPDDNGPVAKISKKLQLILD